MIHYWRPPIAHLLGGEAIDTGHCTDAMGVVACQACRDIIDERTRGTVARSMRRRQLVQAQAAIANDVLWRRGYPLPDSQPIVPCEHMKFAASVDVVTVTADDHSFQISLDSETISLVPRTTTHEIHGYKAYATKAASMIRGLPLVPWRHRL